VITEDVQAGLEIRVEEQSSYDPLDLLQIEGV
jgi:hypothetical protein